MEQVIRFPGLEETYDQIVLKAVGGMAEVFRARQKTLDRPVAIKRIRPELNAKSEIQARFRREAKFSANLLHQNLAHVYDFVRKGDESYIIMEWIEGYDLAEMIERAAPLPIDLICVLALKVLNGISFIHSHGLVHRDIKPDNVRVSLRGEVKIMDFGIAYDPSEDILTSPGTLMGSPHYLSPEQITGEKVDARSDLWSFGVTLYEILTSKRPFFETQTDSVFNRIKKGAYIPAQEMRPDVPPVLSRIIDSCLQVKPSKRPKSAEVVHAALFQFFAQSFSADFEPRVRKFLMEKQLLTGNPELIVIGEKTDPKLFISQKRRIPWAAVLSTVLATAALGVVAYALSQRPKVEQLPLEAAPEATTRRPQKSK